MHFGCVDENVEGALADVESDLVAVADEGDGSAVDCLGCHVSDAEAGGSAGESAVGEQQDVLAQARALDGSGDREHFAHSGSALGSLVADDDDVACRDGAVFESIHGRAFALENSCGTDEYVGIETGGLDDGSARGE
ncbi:hypothetical protein SRABI91_01099 [Rhodococcoides fascians]|nr:hypothetical protein SRABI91_01099 [Rhodococcus fascians]